MRKTLEQRQRDTKIAHTAAALILLLVSASLYFGAITYYLATTR